MNSSGAFLRKLLRNKKAIQLGMCVGCLVMSVAVMHVNEDISIIKISNDIIPTLIVNLFLLIICALL